MNATTREIAEGRMYQGKDEIILYTLDVTKWGNGPGVLLVTALRTDGSNIYTDVSSSVLVGIPSAAGNIITLPAVRSLVPGVLYRINIQFNLSTSTKVAYAEIMGQL